jgi:hypothetical protein
MHRRKRAPPPEVTRETWRGSRATGAPLRVPGPGGRPSEPGKPGNRRVWCDRPGKAPSIPYMEGALSYCARPVCLRLLPTRRVPPLPAIASAAGRRDRRTPAATAPIRSHPRAMNGSTFISV